MGRLIRDGFTLQRTRRAGADARSGRWQVVTVGVSAAELLPDGRWPEPLRPLADAVELHLRPAPGGRGTELAIRRSAGWPPCPGWPPTWSATIPTATCVRCCARSGSSPRPVRCCAPTGRSPSGRRPPARGRRPVVPG